MAELKFKDMNFKLYYQSTLDLLSKSSTSMILKACSLLVAPVAIIFTFRDNLPLALGVSALSSSLTYKVSEAFDRAVENCEPIKHALRTEFENWSNCKAPAVAAGVSAILTLQGVSYLDRSERFDELDTAGKFKSRLEGSSVRLAFEEWQKEACKDFLLSEKSFGETQPDSFYYAGTEISPICK